MNICHIDKIIHERRRYNEAKLGVYDSTQSYESLFHIKLTSQRQTDEN